MSKALEVIVLAAGEGKRMNSRLPKVLQPVGGRPMLAHLFDAVAGLQPARVHCVIGSGSEQVRQAFEDRDIQWVEQHERLGTGHATIQAMPGIDSGSRVLVLPGDTPLVETRTLSLVATEGADLSILEFRPSDVTGYGRILRDEDGRVVGIREEKDASESERAIGEANSGILSARADLLAGWLERLDNDNAQGEYYLTDCIRLAAESGASVQAHLADDPEQLLGANNRRQLAVLEQAFQARATGRLLDAGVTLADPSSVVLRGSVETGRDVFVDRNVALQGQVRLGDEVTLGIGCVIVDCDLAAGTRVHPYSVLEGVRTTGACQIGPFARLRPGSELAEGSRIGNFVEMKNTRLGPGAKANHLTYLGDAEIGPGANIGAGTITCNYDGANKHTTRIGADAFIGSNSALVAPVKIGEKATIGAGSVITQAAPAGELTLARARQKTLEGWSRPVRKPPRD